nr:DUF1836 domain-containing protein [Lachnoclostridium phytofermentans]
MDKQREKEIMELIEGLRKINYVKPGDVPNIDLYMDQVTTFMDKHLESSKRYSEDKLLTKTMINNYTKNNLLPSSNKKKYSKDHMYLLIFIYYMKNVLSINDIQSILTPLTEKFFEGDNKVSLEEIYEEIFRQGEENSMTVSKDVIRKYQKSKDAYPEMKDQEDHDFLQMFSFVCMLCFDVYMKKQMIEKIIDDHFTMPSEKDKNTKEKSKDHAKDKDKSSK